MAPDEAKKAISQINGKNVGGRALTVNEARPKEDRPSGGPRRDFGEAAAVVAAGAIAVY